MNSRTMKYVPHRHWTPRYLIDRVREGRYRHNFPDLPWLTPASIDILTTWLRPTDVAVEFGSGKSTAWFANRVKTLTSVEHNPEWYGRVRPTVEPLGVDYRLCTDAVSYIAVAQALAPASVDFVLVDGQHRAECVLAVIDAIRPGGLLVLDNANRYLPSPGTRSPYQLSHHALPWEDVVQRLGAWRTIWTTNGITDTALFIKTPG